RITRALAGALLISIVTHGIFAFAVALTPAAPATTAAEQTSYFSSTRVVHLDWDKYNAQNDTAAAPEAPNNAPQEPEVAAAVAEPVQSDDRKHVQRREITPEPDKSIESEDHDVIATAPVQAIVNTGDDTKIQLPDSNNG